MENVFSSLDELKKEKSRLERQLEETRKKRQSLERDLDRANVGYDQVHEKHRLLTDQHAAVQGKLEQTMACIGNLQNSRDQDTQKLEQLQNAIDSGKENQDQMVLDFNEKLSRIAADLFEARRCYAKENDNEQTEKVKDEIKKCNGKNKSLSLEVQELKQIIEELGLKCENMERNRYGVEKTIEVCLSALDRDETDAKQRLSCLQQEVNDLETSLRNEEE